MIRIFICLLGYAGFVLPQYLAHTTALFWSQTSKACFDAEPGKRTVLPASAKPLIHVDGVGDGKVSVGSFALSSKYHTTCALKYHKNCVNIVVSAIMNRDD